MSFPVSLTLSDFLTPYDFHVAGLELNRRKIGHRDPRTTFQVAAHNTLRVTKRTGCQSTPEMLKIGPIDVTDLLCTSDGGLTYWPATIAAQGAKPLQHTIEAKLLTQCQCQCQFIQGIIAKITPLMRSMCRIGLLFKGERLQCATKESICMSGSGKLSRNKFHVVGPATAKVRRLYVSSWNLGKTSRLRLA